jgi:hypothetical protein
MLARTRRHSRLPLIGFIDDERFGDRAASLRMFLSARGGREWEQRHRCLHPSVFQKRVDAEIVDPTDAGWRG